MDNRVEYGVTDTYLHFAGCHHVAFRIFVQRTYTRPVRYQALWLLPVGLGTHQDLWDDSPVFIRSNEKSYHVLVKDRQRHAGMTHRDAVAFDKVFNRLVAKRHGKR